MKEDREAIIKEIEKIEAEKPTNMSVAKAKNDTLAEKQSALKYQDTRIKEAEARMGDYESRLAEIKKQEVALEERKRQAVEKSLPKGSLDEAGKIKPLRARLGDNATEIAHKRLANLPFVYAGEKADDDRIAKQMRKVVGDTETNKYLKRMLTLAEETRTQEEREHREVLRQGRTTQRIIRESGESGTPPPSDTTKH